MKIKLFNELTSDSILVREEVFIREQGFIEEFDDTDKIACHLVAFDGDKPVGTCRFFFNKYRQSWIIGRVAVLEIARGLSVGSLIINEAEKHIREMNGKLIELAAQKQAEHFYAKNGYVSFGELFYDEHCLHTWMRKELV